MYPFPLILLQIFLFQQLHSLIYSVPTKHEKEKKSYFKMYNWALLGTHYLGTYIFFYKKKRDKNVNVSTLIFWYWSRNLVCSIYEIGNVSIREKTKLKFIIVVKKYKKTILASIYLSVDSSKKQIADEIWDGSVRSNNNSLAFVVHCSSVASMEAAIIPSYLRKVSSSCMLH